MLNRSRARLALGIILIPTLAWAAAATPPAADQDDTTVLEMIREADRATADRGLAYARSLYDAKTDKEKQFADIAAQGDYAGALLERAVIKKFGKADSEKVLQAMGFETTSEIETATIKIDGTHASVVWKDGATPEPLIRVNGHWRIPAAEYMKQMVDQGFKDPVGYLADFKKMCDSLAADVTAGKYTSADDLATDAAAAADKITPDSVKNAPVVPNI